MLKSEQLQVVHHMYMYDGSDVYSVTIIYKITAGVIECVPGLYPSHSMKCTYQYNYTNQEDLHVGEIP